MFDHLVGQNHVKKLLEIMIKAANENDNRISDILLAGPGGVGKSTFARCIANFVDCDFIEINASSISSTEDLINYTVINQGIDVIKIDMTKEIYLPRIIYFIDESHKLKDPLKTELLNALEGSRRTTFFVKKNEQIFTADFSNVTFIFATTDKNDLSGPLLTRFDIFELNPYSNDEIASMIQKTKQWDYDICFEIAKRCKNVMRTAVKEIKKVQDYIDVERISLTKEAIINYYTVWRQLDDCGLDFVDYNILSVLNNTQGAMGLKNLSSRLCKNIKEIEERESFMASKGLIDKTGRGRIITELGKEKLLNKELVLQI